jgi:ribulose kinase
LYGEKSIINESASYSQTRLFRDGNRSHVDPICFDIGPRGGSRSDPIVADVFDRPIRRITVNDAAGAGAVICAAVGHGICQVWGQATAAMVSGDDEFALDPRAARTYQEVNKMYATLTAFTDPLCHSMADRLQGLERAPAPGRG